MARRWSELARRRSGMGASPRHAPQRAASLAVAAGRTRSGKPWGYLVGRYPVARKVSESEGRWSGLARRRSEVGRSRLPRASRREAWLAAEARRTRSGTPWGYLAGRYPVAERWSGLGGRSRGTAASPPHASRREAWLAAEAGRTRSGKPWGYLVGRYPVARKVSESEGRWSGLARRRSEVGRSRLPRASRREAWLAAEARRTRSENTVGIPGGKIPGGKEMVGIGKEKVGNGSFSSSRSLKGSLVGSGGKANEVGKTVGIPGGKIPGGRERVGIGKEMVGIGKEKVGSGNVSSSSRFSKGNLVGSGGKANEVGKTVGIPGGKIPGGKEMVGIGKDKVGNGSFCSSRSSKGSLVGNGGKANEVGNTGGKPGGKKLRSRICQNCQVNALIVLTHVNGGRPTGAAHAAAARKTTAADLIVNQVFDLDNNRQRRGLKSRRGKRVDLVACKQERKEPKRIEQA
nr:hypothetical protein CFP56_28558 [Quercus suber]